MDVSVTIEVVNGYRRVRFERGVPIMSDFSYDDGDHKLFVHPKGEAREKLDDAKGTGGESKAKNDLELEAKEAMQFVRWLNPDPPVDEVPF